jgi:hypothetical protein
MAIGLQDAADACRHAPRGVRIETDQPRVRLMEKAEIEMLARRAGLEKALKEHPEDVAAAANQAAGVVARMQAPTDPKAEPWPPMKAGIGL